MLTLWEDGDNLETCSIDVPARVDSSLLLTTSSTGEKNMPWYAKNNILRRTISDSDEKQLLSRNKEKKSILDAGNGIRVLAHRSSLTLPVIGR